MKYSRLRLALILTLPLLAGFAFAQPPFGGGQSGGFTFTPGPGRGRGNQRTELLGLFDKAKKGFLNAEERTAAREFIHSRLLPGRGGRGRGGGGGTSSTAAVGPTVKPADVKNYGKESLYDPAVLRTLFLQFEENDWELELQDFAKSDVKVPAKLTVDGKTYENVGVSFRGNSSYSSIPFGRKRSFDLEMDLVEDKQRLGGYRALNLLNAHQDPTFMRSFLYFYVAGQYTAAPKANFVRVVINGESWGVYVNAEQINSDFAKEQLQISKGPHWKISGSPGASAGGLSYLGEDLARYKSAYQIKGKDEPKSWTDLINLTRVLNQTPPDKLEEALAPILDVDGALRFLAVDKALINNDGYWTRASDYGIYEGADGKFHIIPWDSNETWQEEERGRGGAGGSGVAVPPLAGATDSGKALLYRLMAVPALRTRYLGYVRDIAENWLTWEKIGPLVAKEQALIGADVKSDTHKLYSNSAFTEAVTRDGSSAGYGMAPPEYSLKTFIEERHDYLLAHPDIRDLPRTPVAARKP